MPKRSNSGSDSDKARLKAKRTALYQLKVDADYARQLLATPEPTFDEIAGPEETLPWFGRLSLDGLSDVLCANRMVNDVPAFIVNFTCLAEMAVSCSLLYEMFFMEPRQGYTDGSLWSKLMLQRMEQKNDGIPVVQKFKFVRTFVQKHWRIGFPMPRFHGLDTYLNWFGVGFCEHCTMYSGAQMPTDRSNDWIPISPFRLMNAEERAAAEHQEMVFPSEGEPENWLVAMQILQQKFPSYYCCINCEHRLDTGKFGIPVSSVFDACLSRSSGTRTGHLWRELETDLKRPDKSQLMTTFNYCCRCGVLDISDEQHECEEDLIPTCPICEEVEELCECENCNSCDRTPFLCRCVICVSCEKCKAVRCSKLCRKNPCACDESSSSELSSSSSDSSGFSDLSSSDNDSE